MAVNIKTIVLWDVMLCSLVESYQLPSTELGDSSFHENTGMNLPDCMASHPTRSKNLTILNIYSTTSAKSMQTT